MSNEMTMFQENSGLELAPEFMPMVAAGLTDDLSQGVGGGFAVVSFKAGKFRIKHKGNEIPITDDRGDPVGSIETVIIRANGHITKQWYSKPYDDGDSSAPDCFSLDGVVPAPSAPKVQAKSCAMCPKNAFGSAPPRDGKPSKGKACQDNRKLAIVPLMDINNETFGGPMLFRVPPSALNDLAQFGAAWKARGYPYNALGVRIGMDMDTSYPKPTFKAIRPLTSEEAQQVLALVHSPAVERILVDLDPTGAAPVNQGGPEFEQEPEAPAPAPAPAPKPVAAKPVAAKPVAPKAPAATFGKPQAAAPAAPAKAATFGGKPKPASAPAPAAPTKGKAKVTAAPEPAEEAADVEAADPSSGGSMESDIEKVLAELNANA